MIIYFTLLVDTVWWCSQSEAFGCGWQSQSEAFHHKTNIRLGNRTTIIKMIIMILIIINIIIAIMKPIRPWC